MGSTLEFNISLNLTVNATVNSTTSSLIRFMSFPKSWITTWTGVYLSLCFEGTLGNFLLLAIILFNRKLRTGCGLLIVHCLVAYVVVCGINFPILAISLYLKQIHKMEINSKYCNPIMWLQMAVRYAAMWIDAYIAVNRVIALCFPLRYRNFSNKKTEAVVLIVLWTVAGLFSLLGVFNIGASYALIPLGTCGAFPKGRFGMLTLIIGIYAPLAFTAAAYILIYVKMMGRSKISVIRGADERSSQRIAKRRVATANMMCVSFLWNLLCSLVLPVGSAVIKVNEADIRFQLISMWLVTANMLGYALNPVIFLAMKEDYRLALSRVFCRKTRKIVGSSALGSDSANPGKSNGTRSRASEGGSTSVTSTRRVAFSVETAI